MDSNLTFKSREKDVFDNLHETLNYLKFIYKFKEKEPVKNKKIHDEIRKQKKNLIKERNDSDSSQNKRMRQNTKWRTK